MQLDLFGNFANEGTVEVSSPIIDSGVFSVPEATLFNIELKKGNLAAAINILENLKFNEIEKVLLNGKFTGLEINGDLIRATGTWRFKVTAIGLKIIAGHIVGIIACTGTAVFRQPHRRLSPRRDRAIGPPGILARRRRW